MTRMQTNVTPAKKRRHSNLWRILADVKPYWALVLLCLLSVVLINVATLAKPYIIETVIDDFFYENKPESGWYSIAGMAALYMITIAVASVFTYVQALIVNHIGQSIILKMRRRVFSYIQRMPLTALDKISAGRLITRATNDVESISELFTDVFVNLFNDIILLIGIVIAMVSMSPKLAAISCITLPLIALVTFVTRNKLRKNFTIVKALIGQINGFFAENISGMRVVQIFMKQRAKMREFMGLNKKYYKASMTQILVNSFLRPVMEVINSLAISALIWFSFKDVVAAVILPGVLYAFTDYVKQFFEPINNLAEMYTNIQSASVSADRVYELLDNTHDQEDLEAGDSVERFAGKIEFKNVWFAYIGEDWVLKDVSFTIEPGQRIAFVGTTGSGKTTIISLLTRFYEIQKGAILVDGKDIREMKLADLRRNISVVLQDVFLFAGTVRDNISLDDAIDDAQLDKALELSHSKDFVSQLHGGIDHRVMERGAAFSSGHGQLISFARAIAHDPAVFVLDEATAHIDTDTELLIQNSLNAMAKGRTMILIAHRLSTIRNCDTIFVMNKGQIIESGSHDELLALGGRYAQLHRSQGEQYNA